MKKPFLILVVLLLVSMVSMVWVRPIGSNPAAELSVNPLNIIDTTMQSKPVDTIRPTADGTFKDWTNNTLTVRPNLEGTYSDLNGRILTLKPNDQGTYSDWGSWVHLIPNGEGNFTGWFGSYSGWRDWPTYDEANYQYAGAHNLNDTSELVNPPALPRALPITKVRLTIVAKDYPSDTDENVQMMLSTLIHANISSFTEASDWTGWQRVGNSPWLDGADYPLNYINTTTAAKIGNFTFADVPTTGITWISPLQLRLRTWQSGGGGNDTLRIYLYDGSIWSSAYTVTPLTTVGSYRDIDVSTFLNTVEKINATKMAIEKVTDANGVSDNVYVDYACIRLSGVRKTASYGVTTSLTTTYASKISEWATNPFTGLAWTWADIDNLQAGVRSVQGGISWSGYLRVTQLYVSVLTGGLYTDWDEWPDPTAETGGTTDYVFATADAKRQSSALPDTPSPPFPTIAKVQVSVVARANMSTDEEIQIMVGIPPFELTANVDGYVSGGTGWTGWTRTGSSPWLDAADYNTNYISTSAKEGIGDFSFQNIASGTTWSAVKLRIKTWQTGNDYLKIELYDGNLWSIVTSTFKPPTTAGYTEFDVSGFLSTATKVNATKMRLTHDADGSADTIYVDHAYLSLLRVYYGSPINPSTSYLTYSSEWTTSPATGLAWTWADIDALQAGVKSKLGTVDPPTWTGELRVTQLYVRVIEAGTYANWDEAAQDQDDTYNSAISGALSRSSQLQNHGSETWSIARVQVSVVARADIDQPSNERERLRIMLVIGGVRYNSSDFTPTTAYATYSYVWPKNPATNLAWGSDWTVIDNLQAGVSSVQYGAAWKGEVRATQLYAVVSRDGTYAQWDEATQNGDTDYVSATMKDMKESSQLQNPTHQSWDIARVRVVFYARVAETTDEKVQPILVIGGLEYTGADSEKYTLTTNYIKYTGDWGKNPDTDDYWTWDDIDALEAGVKSIVSDDELWTSEIRVTQLYVEVAGPRFMVYVEVADVTNLYSYEFFLNYTANVLTVASISLGGWFPYDSVIWLNEINDTAGYAHYSVSMPFGSPSGLTGSGILANITFFVDSYGESMLDLWNTKLRNPAAGSIVHNVNDGYFNNMILGDITRDKIVNTADLSDFSGVYGSTPTTFNWDHGDFTRDNKTDAYDLFDLGKNYGKSISP